MEHVAAILLLIGCSDHLDCRELPAPTPIFETRQECDDALPSSLGAFTGQYEQLFAQCIPVDPAMEEEDAQLVWDVRPDGTLVAAVEAAPSVMVAGSH